jgi:hypothetical protein
LLGEVSVETGGVLGTQEIAGITPYTQNTHVYFTKSMFCANVWALQNSCELGKR